VLLAQKNTRRKKTWLHDQLSTGCLLLPPVCCKNVAYYLFYCPGADHLGTCMGVAQSQQWRLHFINRRTTFGGAGITSASSSAKTK
jgi:hypothetical protein